MEKDLISDPGKAAKERFAQKFNCAQSVFSAFASTLGLNEETALKIASPFGGGVARRGEICGAVTGALMVLGMARGSSTPEEKEKTYRMGQEFLRRFEAGHKSILCRGLVGYDIGSPEEYARAKESGVFQSVCPLVVREAAELAQAMLKEG
jgi:C_GCAxxG_C_C family probable redox protein